MSASAGFLSSPAAGRPQGIPADRARSLFRWNATLSVLHLVQGLGILAISFLLRYLRTRSFNIFVAYRLVLAAIILVAFLAR